MVAEPPAPSASTATPAVAVGENGLPEGVKILPMGPASAQPEIKSLIKPRARLESAGPDEPKPAPAKAKTAAKKRKPGRPKAARLDTPRTIASDAPTPLPSAPKIAPPVVTPAGGIRSMSDIAPRRPAPTRRPKAAAQRPAKASEGEPKPKQDAGAKPAAPTAHTVPKAHRQLHKVGVPPLHYGAVMAFSLRARVRPRLVALASLAALSFAAAIAYGTWLLLTSGLPHLAGRLAHGGLRIAFEAALLAALYYVGRSIGQAAITFGVAREADQRPVPLTRQIGVGINTFGRRLILDSGFALAEVALLGLVAGLVLTGGESWPLSPQLQVAAIFCTFLALLYLLTALALTRGLAGVAITLTNQEPWAATRLGWQLFSHRFELLGLRFTALALELVLAIPLAALALAFILSAPAQWHLLVVAAVAVLAWLAGALLGAGTATWWAALYRRLVLADRPADAINLLSARKAQDAGRGPLSLIISLSTLLAAATLALPWMKIF